MAGIITYGSQPPHHPQRLMLGEEITGQYMPHTFLYVNNFFWLGKLQFFLGETEGERRVYANVDVHAIKPALIDLAYRGALSKSIYAMRRKIYRRGTYEQVEGAGVEIWGGSISQELSRCLVLFDPLTTSDGIIIEVSQGPGLVGTNGQITARRGAERERLFIALDRALMRVRATEALAHITAWEAEGMPSVDHLQAFLQGKAHGVRMLDGPYPVSRAEDWKHVRVEKYVAYDKGYTSEGAPGRETSIS